MEHINTFSYSPQDLSLMPKRPYDGNKGTFGRVLCLCGSRGMAGAAYLSAKAALKSGAGLAEILTSEFNLPIIQGLLPEAVVSVCGEQETLIRDVERRLSHADSLVLGCGIGTSRLAVSAVSCALRRTEIPTVIDADALNIIAKNKTLLKYAKGKIITPHPAEMSRLTGLSVNEIEADRERICRDFAKEHSLICVLKGHRTCVSDGSERVYVNASGNDGMATAGSGDVLAGIIGSILSQARNTELSLFETACLGVYIHGLCGDAAARRVGRYSLMASDIIDALSEVLKQAE